MKPLDQADSGQLVSNMKKFRVYYSYDIKHPKTDLTVQYDKGVFEIEAESTKKINSKLLKGRIAKIAQDARNNPDYYVGYSNYYRLEEIKDKG